MEYEDELERMRNRRRRQKAQDYDSRTGRRLSGSGAQRQRVMESSPGISSGSRGTGRQRGEEDYGSQRRRRERPNPRNYNDRYDDDNYEYERHRNGRHDDYNSYRNHGSNRDDYEEYDDYDEYSDDYGADEYDDYDYGDDSRRDFGSYGGGQGSRRRREKRPRKKKRRFLILKVFLLLIILAGAYFVFKFKQTGTGYWTIAVFGVDSREGNLEKGALSDVEMLCVIDRGTGDIKLVSVFRDTYLEINPDGTYHKINEAYFKGGHEQAVQALERNLDLSIDDYATFNWKTVAAAINVLGGIDLEISDSEFKYINSFITETVNSTGIGSYQLEHAGMNHLDGIQAVAYARLRLMDTDYNRTARQRLVIQLAMNKAKEADLKTLTSLAKAILPQISTSIGVDDILPMVRNLSKFHIVENGGFPFSRGETHIGKKDCVIPLTLESNVIQLHQFLYGIENFQPSGTVRRISAQIAADSGMGEVAENAPEAKILGQRALEGSDPEASDSGGSSGSSQNEQGSGGGSDNPLPPETETVPPQTTEAPQESSTEESAEESSSSVEESQEETTTSEPVQEPGSGAPPKESEIGPGYTETPSEVETEAEDGPGMTEAEILSSISPEAESEGLTES